MQEVSLKPDGITVKMDEINQVGIADIKAIASYELQQDGPKTTHLVTFKKGGTLTLSYSKIEGSNKGELHDFSGKNLKISTDPSKGTVTVSEAD
ncbi:hypothetical protein [Stenotrophomonas maltophilia]|uniref:hypothetical protein n=1 Tax=Stenotrophomonas maltophilia TaxID=40324 RepID=UPI000C14F26F|nr:hypothetical protein [Stenotrophomonas maltophilia]